MVQSNNHISSRQIGRQKRKPKGTVKVESDKGWLRLRFTCGGKRRAFALGLPDTGINQKFAEQKARQIELDILSDNFDSSLQKYKPQKTSEEIKANLITAEGLILKFIEEKSKSVSSVDSLHQNRQNTLGRKPRTYRQKARKDYLKVAKKQRAIVLFKVY